MQLHCRGKVNGLLTPYFAILKRHTVASEASLLLAILDRLLPLHRCFVTWLPFHRQSAAAAAAGGPNFPAKAPQQAGSTTSHEGIHASLTFVDTR